MKLKRILAALLAASAVSLNAFAFTPFLPEEVSSEPETEASSQEQKENSSESASDKVEENEKKENNKTGVINKFLPKDYRYKIFEQTLDLYVEKHLYDFTEEEVLHKFFSDFLDENPMFFESFMDYLLGTMDPYSGYHDADSGFLNPASESVGFGFTVKDSDDGVYINSIVAGSNADAAGLKAGDKFVSVAGIDVTGHTFSVVSTLLAKPQSYSGLNSDEAAVQEKTEEAEAKEITNPEFEIVIERNGEKLTFNLAKGPMSLSQLSTTIDENDEKPTAYIQVMSFLGKDTDKEFNELVKKYADDGIKHLTIDLRDNGGGSLELALSMVETFLEKDELICYYDDRTIDEPKPVYSTTDKTSFNSITVLINENTASAAELFASILQDKGLAKVIGTKSFGKSLGQEVFTLITGDYVTITTYQMLNEKLESYDGIGIIPDLSIEEVEMCYILPELGIFNHQNYVEIKEGEYSEVTKALEDRLEIIGLLRKDYCDGVFDDKTKTALYFLQKERGIPATGYVDYTTVSHITKIINSYKPDTYFDDTQYDVAMIVHHSFSQGKRLVNEKERLRKEQAKLIEERDAALNAAYDAEHTDEDSEESNESEKQQKNN